MTVGDMRLGAGPSRQVSRYSQRPIEMGDCQQEKVEKPIATKDLQFAFKTRPSRLKWDEDDAPSVGSSIDAIRGAAERYPGVLQLTSTVFKPNHDTGEPPLQSRCRVDCSDFTTCSETKSLSDSCTSFLLTRLDTSSSKGSANDSSASLPHPRMSPVRPLSIQTDYPTKGGRFLSDASAASVHSGRSGDAALKPPTQRYRQASPPTINYAVSPPRRKASPPMRLEPTAPMRHYGGDLVPLRGEQRIERGRGAHGFEDDGRGRGYYQPGEYGDRYRTDGGRLFIGPPPGRRRVEDDSQDDRHYCQCARADYYDDDGYTLVARDSLARDLYHSRMDEDFRRGRADENHRYNGGRCYDQGYDDRFDTRYDGRRRYEPRYVDEYDPRYNPDLVNEHSAPKYRGGYYPSRQDLYCSHGGCNGRSTRYNDAQFPPRTHRHDDYRRSPKLAPRSTSDQYVQQACQCEERRRAYFPESLGEDIKEETCYRPSNIGNRDAFQTNGRKGQLEDDKVSGPGPDDPIYIEVFPGVSERLRRTKETEEAIEQDFYAPAKCFACGMEVFCIADVKYFICPECKCVSPLSKDDSCLTGKDHSGVGIAFGFETLFKIQSEIVHRRGDSAPKLC